MQLFKYVTADRFDILENELIRFSPASALNDPWEMKPHLEQYISDEGLREIIERNDNPEAQYQRAFKQYWRAQRKRIPGLSQRKAFRMFDHNNKVNPHILPLTRRVAEVYALTNARKRDYEFKELFLELFERLGVLSLTEEPNNLLMWAHYCDCHRGFVMELNPQHQFFTKIKKHAPVKTIGRMVYAEKLPHLNEAKDILKDNAGLDAMLFTKDQRWSYENEWRLVADSRDANSNKTLPNGEVAWLYNMPADCIQRVILGCLMSDENKKKITDYLITDKRYQHVRLQEAVRVEREYNLIFKNVSRSAN